MTWMLTATGAQVDLRFIAAESISVLDIAHHLAQINRYCGACSRPYSVAEHSLLVCEILEREAGITDPSILQAALMHDAHEAYTQDLSTPMKQLVGEAWHREEERVQHAVLKRFKLLAAYAAARERITRADLVALVTERRALLPAGDAMWPAEFTYRPAPWAELASRSAFTWQDWRDCFIERFGELQYARAEIAALHTSEPASADAPINPVNEPSA
jgi:hypothetical protein